jgi:GGDEF domain-containing protein
VLANRACSATVQHALALALLAPARRRDVLGLDNFRTSTIRSATMRATGCQARRRLVKSTRPSAVARLGGDEFAILLEASPIIDVSGSPRPSRAP